MLKYHFAHQLDGVVVVLGSEREVTSRLISGTWRIYVWIYLYTHISRLSPLSLSLSVCLQSRLHYYCYDYVWQQRQHKPQQRPPCPRLTSPLQLASQARTQPASQAGSTFNCRAMRFIRKPPQCNLWRLSEMKKLKIDYDKSGTNVNYLPAFNRCWLHLPLSCACCWPYATASFVIALPCHATPRSLPESFVFGASQLEFPYVPRRRLPSFAHFAQLRPLDPILMLFAINVQLVL